MKARAIIPTPAEFEAARRRSEEAGRVEPRADRVEYDRRKKHLVIHLRRGAIVAIPIQLLDEFRGATVRQLAEIQATRSGDGVESEELDMHVSLKGLLRDLVGLTGAAAMMGSQGGKSKSPAKASAARANGKRGGRPRKKSAA
jgi:Protein of unknown function (DUF2442)